MNVLGICLSPGKGGLEIYACQAILALKNAGNVCHFAISPDSYTKDRFSSITLIEIQPLFRLAPVLAAWKLAKYIDVHEIDVIHMHWNKDLNLSVLAKSFSRRKPKLVYTRHMEITRSKRDLYHKALYSRVDRMLVIADFVRKQAIRYLPLRNEQVILLYLGVHAAEIVSPDQCKALITSQAESHGDFVIGLIGRIEHYKGQHILLEALRIVKTRVPHPVVVMAGPVMDDAYYKSIMEKTKQSGLEGNVIYQGITKEPGKLMSCCDVVVLTTFCETFGLVLAEAMRAGTAVIGTNAGGVPEIITHNETGMLYEPGNVQQLADQLIELYTDESKRKSIAHNGKEYADRMFSEERHFNELERIIRGL